jgi:hypothetical protein
MRRLCVLAAVALLAGCGGKGSSEPSASATASAATATATVTATSTSSPVPTVTGADAIAACVQLEQAVRAVSALVGHTTEGITQALHPDELADRTGTAQQSLLDSAKLVALVPAPEPLAGPQRQMEDGLRMFAADFGRAKASAAAGDINKAAAQTVDEKALRMIQKSAKRIDDLCGA